MILSLKFQMIYVNVIRENIFMFNSHDDHGDVSYRNQIYA